MKRALVVSAASVAAFGVALTAMTLVPSHHLAGALNPAVKQSTIATTVCVPGWTATVRPSSSYTHSIKVRLWQEAGSHGQIGEYELDHIVPLEVGGAPKDLRNLQLQPWDGPDGAHAKDAVENRVKREVCAGTVTLAAGQRCFRIDWRRCP
jgi:hypothetical protein